MNDRGINTASEQHVLSQILIAKSQKCHSDVQRMTDQVMCDTLKGIKRFEI